MIPDVRLQSIEEMARDGLTNQFFFNLQIYIRIYAMNFKLAGLSLQIFYKNSFKYIQHNILCLEMCYYFPL